MKVINETVYETRDLKAIFQKAAEMELEPAARKRLRVKVVYSRGRHSGCAWLNSSRATVRVPHPYSRARFWVKLSPTKLAFLACHEFAHCRGMQHQQMPSYLKDWSAADAHERYIWARELSVRVKTPVVRRVSMDDKLAHVQRRLALAKTRAQRAATLLKKWQRKERYYLKAAAAKRAEAR